MKGLITSIKMFMVLTLLLGVFYPLAVWSIGLIVFPAMADGSLVFKDGNPVGSELIGQAFDSPGYFHSRPSAAGNGYDAAASGGSNLGPTSRKLIDRIKADADGQQQDNTRSKVPADLVTTSASGLDPNISPAAAAFQVPRIAKERGMTEAEIESLVSRFTEGRQLGFLGEPRVNVLLLNLELDRTKELRK